MCERTNDRNKYKLLVDFSSTYSFYFFDKWKITRNEINIKKQQYASTHTHTCTTHSNFEGPFTQKQKKKKIPIRMFENILHISYMCCALCSHHFAFIFHESSMLPTILGFGFNGISNMLSLNIE